MKRFLVTILAMLYLASVTGANIHLHYCMGVLVSWKLNEKNSQNKCSKCGMTSKKGCCEDKHKFVTGEKDQKMVKAGVNIFKTPVSVITNSYCNYTLTYTYKDVRELLFRHTPPDKPNVPVYISNCVFRI